MRRRSWCAWLLPLCLVACAPPMTHLEAAREVALDLSIQGSPFPNPEETQALEGVKAEVQTALTQALGPKVRVVEAAGHPAALRLQVDLLAPEPAEVPGPALAFKRALGENLLRSLTAGLASTRLEDRMARMGVDRERFQARWKAYEDRAIFEWGPFEKTAKRAKLQQLGYAPLLFHGRYRLEDPLRHRDLAADLFFGWESVKAMEPLPTATGISDDTAILRASAQGFARHLVRAWSR